MANNVLKPRFKNHDILNNVVRKDWIVAIESSPDSFQALLYMPTVLEHTAEDTDAYEKPLFQKLDTNQQAQEYADPFVVSLIDNPDDTRAIVSEDGQSSSSSFDEPMVVRIGFHGVPTGAILEWEEVVDHDTTRRCWWYVHSAISIGTTLSAAVHNLIPCRDFEGIKDND
jgi:hypothetical protein